MVKVKLIFSCHGFTRDCVKIYELLDAESEIKIIFYFDVCVGRHSYCKTQGVKGIPLRYPTVKLCA
jgi:hypothetical protein